MIDLHRPLSGAPPPATSAATFCASLAWLLFTGLAVYIILLFLWTNFTTHMNSFTRHLKYLKHYSGTYWSSVLPLFHHIFFLFLPLTDSCMDAEGVDCEGLITKEMFDGNLGNMCLYNLNTCCAYCKGELNNIYHMSQF